MAKAPVMLPTPWRSLGTPSEELRLEWTLPTGQTFQWRRSSSDPNLYTGVLARRLLQMRQLDGDVEWRTLARAADARPEGDAEAIARFLRLDVQLGPLVERWAAADEHFASVAADFPGERRLCLLPLRLEK